VTKLEHALHLTDDTLVHLADGTYSFCDLLKFEFDGEPSSAELIAAVLVHPRYHDMFVSPWTRPQEGVHGPYRLEALTVEGFRACSVAEALQVLHDWMADPDVNPKFMAEMLESQEIVAAWTSPMILGADQIYRLIVPREGNEHGCGWISGMASGFHELITIDRRNNVLMVIVATDD
jgi:hypothetical protein